MGGGDSGSLLRLVSLRGQFGLGTLRSPLKDFCLHEMELLLKFQFSAECIFDLTLVGLYNLRTLIIQLLGNVCVEHGLQSSSLDSTNEKPVILGKLTL